MLRRRLRCINSGLPLFVMFDSLFENHRPTFYPQNVQNIEDIGVSGYNKKDLLMKII